MHQFELFKKVDFRESSVYAAGMPNFDDFTKIGITDRLPQVRVREQGLLEIYETWPCPNSFTAELVESLAHSLLKREGLNFPRGFLGTSREVFRCKPEKAVYITTEAYKQVFFALGEDPKLCLDKKQAKRALGLGERPEQLQLIKNMSKPQSGLMDRCDKEEPSNG